MTIETIGIIGAGQMGNGIAHVCSLAKLDVIMVDNNPAQLNKALETIRANMNRQVKRGLITQADEDAAIKRIKTSQSLKDLSPSDFVIEAATENPELKFKIFEQISKIAKSDAILATNTSSISITAIAARLCAPLRA